MVGLLMFMCGVAVGAGAVQFGLPLLKERFPGLARAVQQVQLPTALAPPSGLRAKIDSIIADLEGQLRNRVDVDRNLTRLAQLRELIGGDQ